MLNELINIANALESAGVSLEKHRRHPRIGQGKNETALLVLLNADGIIAAVDFYDGKNASELFRIEHGSPGSSFPGFNIPAPLRKPNSSAGADLTKLEDIAKKKDTNAAELAILVRRIFDASTPSEFTNNQKQQFSRSCGELVQELVATFIPENKPQNLAGMESFLLLIKTAKEHPLELESFAENLAKKLASPDFLQTQKKDGLELICSILFGKPKAKKNQPVYLDVATPDLRRVANLETSACLNDACFKTKLTFSTYSGTSVFDRNTETRIMEKYPECKLPILGNVRLFSVNTGEADTFWRYRLGGSETFPVSADDVIRMNAVLLYLARENQEGKTYIVVPDSKDEAALLFAYLDGANGNEDDDVADMFGTATDPFAENDFAARTQKVLSMFRGERQRNPDKRVRLFAIGKVDTANKQILLNRSYTVASIADATDAWNDVARNIPNVSVYWKTEKVERTNEKGKTVKESKHFFKTASVPSPIDLVHVLNKVWSSDAKQGFAPSFQSAFSIADAYDIFISEGNTVFLEKTNRALHLLVSRMAVVLGAIGARKQLGENVRKHALKAIPFLGLLLHKLNPNTNIKEKYMKEPLYHVGQLLALADLLHQKYGEIVRGDVPNQLIGSALFNTALDSPQMALRRLAERITPYQAWLRTYNLGNRDPKKERLGWLRKKIRECAARFIEDVNGVFHVRTDELPQRMSDEDKAKLLLGYLADTYEPEKGADDGSADGDNTTAGDTSDTTKE